MKTILFDVDDTLYDQLEPFKKGLMDIFKDKLDESILTPDIVEKIFAVSRKYSDEVFEKTVTGEMSMDRMYIYRIKNALREFGIRIDDRTSLNFQKHYLMHQNEIALSQDIKVLIKGLTKRGDIVGIVSNGPSVHQWNKIKKLQILELIPKKNIIISGDVGFSKPDLKIFRLAQKRMPSESKEYIFVGDSLDNDVEGAKKAGMITVWMNRRNHSIENKHPLPDYEVKSESQLLKLLL